MTTPREPLTPEERALAERLARAPGPREPGPSLDARILAAARTAVESGDAAADDPAPSQPVTPVTATSAPSIQATPAPHRRRSNRRRWTLGMGVAASVLLAVTISWQLRPQQTTSRVYESAQAPDAAQSQAIAADNSAAQANARSQANDTAAAPPTPLADAPMAEAPRAPANAKALPPPPEAPSLDVAPVPPAAPKMLPQRDASMPMPAMRAQQRAPAPADVAPAAPAPAPRQVETYTPPAPPSPPAPVTENLTRDPQPMPWAPAPEPSVSGDARPDSQQEAIARNQMYLKTTQERAASAARTETGTQQGFARTAVLLPPPSPPGPSADQPPSPGTLAVVGEDSRLPTNAWLQRIRKHRFEGHGDLARASLQAFQHAHPDAEIPEDLRKLLP